MKTAIPWVLVVLLAAGCFLLYNGSKEKDDELAKLRQQSDEVEQLRKDNEELKKTAAQTAEELPRLRKDNEELLRLRNEATQLNRQIKQLNSQLATAQAQGTRAEQAHQQALEKLANEKQALAQKLQEDQTKAAPVALAQADICIKNLRLIDGAKQQWALENKKTPDAVPTAADIAPYIPNFSEITCPSGGTYTIGSVQTPPACSVPGHVLK